MLDNVLFDLMKSFGISAIYQGVWLQPCRAERCWGRNCFWNLRKMAHFCLHMEEECSPIPKRKTAFYGLSLASEKTDCFTVEAKISGASHINEPAFVFIRCGKLRIVTRKDRGCYYKAVTYPAPKNMTGFSHSKRSVAMQMKSDRYVCQILQQHNHSSEKEWLILIIN